MVKDQSKCFTIFQADSKSYLFIMLFLSLDLVDRVIHEECANHEEALTRAKELYAAMPDSKNNKIICFIYGICRDAACGCGGKLRTVVTVGGNLHQWYDEKIPVLRQTDGDPDTHGKRDHGSDSRACPPASSDRVTEIF